jgi:hypothetical protein
MAAVVGCQKGNSGFRNSVGGENESIIPFSGAIDSGGQHGGCRPRQQQFRRSQACT